MIIIFSTLKLGGIETYFVRVAEKRRAAGQSTTLLLLSPPEASNPGLIERIQKVASVLFIYDFMRTPLPFGPSSGEGSSRGITHGLVRGLARGMSKAPLIAPLRDEVLQPLIAAAEHIHVSDGSHALFARRLALRYCQAPSWPAISVGFYHYIKFAWGKWDVPYYERVHREFVLRFLPKQALCLYSQDNLEFYKRYIGEDLTGANTFRLGVVDEKPVEVNGECSVPLRICAVGRLVPFKAYNLYMLDIVKAFKDKGIAVRFDVYGSGELHDPMTKKTAALGVADRVTLHGDLDYAQFDEVVGQADIFIGSGTAIIQAASLGVASIVGVESVKTPVSYGYFSDVYTREYNLKGLQLPTRPVIDLISQFIEMSSSERADLRRRHVASTSVFTNQNAADSLHELRAASTDLTAFKFSLLRYELSRGIDKLHARLSKSHPQRAWVKEEW